MRLVSLNFIIGNWKGHSLYIQIQTIYFGIGIWIWAPKNQCDRSPWLDSKALANMCSSRFVMFCQFVVLYFDKISWNSSKYVMLFRCCLPKSHQHEIGKRDYIWPKFCISHQSFYNCCIPFLQFFPKSLSTKLCGELL